MAMPNENPHDLVFWARFGIEQAPPDAFLEIQGEALLQDARYASAKLIEQLVPFADPYLPGRAARHGMFFGELELLAHAYSVGSMPVSIVESASFALVRPEVDLGPPERHLETAQGVAVALLRAAASARLRAMPFQAADESARFSTSPFPAMGMPPPGTIDGGVTSGRLYFLLHKLPEPTGRSVGYPPPTGWLSARLREAWDARATPGDRSRPARP